jgi:hypothetical protein
VQCTAFIIAAYRAYLGYEPSKEDIKRNITSIKFNKKDYKIIIDMLFKERERIINNYNHKRQQSIKLTLNNITKWSKLKQFIFWR